MVQPIARHDSGFVLDFVAQVSTLDDLAVFSSPAQAHTKV